MRTVSASDDIDYTGLFHAEWLRGAVASSEGFYLLLSDSYDLPNAQAGFSLVGKAYQPTALVMMKQKVELKERLKPVKIALDRPTKSRRDLPTKRKKQSIIVKGRKG